MNPQFPVYIVSKGRHESRLTSKAFEKMGVPYSIVVEEQERDAYASVIDPAKIIVLDPAYQRDYDTFDELGDSKGKGPGPARNFVWDHAISRGAAWHWVVDDNIYEFYRFHHNVRIKVSDGAIFKAMEDFSLRYENVAMAGPNYRGFINSRAKYPPFVRNTRIYSCNLIRNDVPLRWRGRYNEDTDLSLRMLKAGWCTVLFHAFLQGKVKTQTMTGGNTSEFYAQEGTVPKSQMLVAMHPDVCRIVLRYGRWHHYCDYEPFKLNGFVRKGEVPAGTNNYGMTLRTAKDQSDAERRSSQAHPPQVDPGQSRQAQDQARP